MRSLSAIPTLALALACSPSNDLNRRESEDAAGIVDARDAADAPLADAVTSDAPPDAPPDAFTGPIDCAGFTATRVLVMDWNDPQTLTTASVGGAGPGDAIVVVFTTGAGIMPNAYGNLVGAEYASSPSVRVASLSTTPCDFASSFGAAAMSKSNTVTMSFSVGSNTSSFYPALAPTTTYYLNVKEPQFSTCVSDGNCDMYFQLHKPPGL